MSRKSVDNASKCYKEIENVRFFQSSIQDYKSDSFFTTCTANMVLMTDPDYSDDLQAIHSLLSDGGNFVFSITHPCFWPHYWGYQNKPWFNYRKECYIEKEFSTSLSQSIGVTTHIHRPLSFYLNGLNGAGFRIAEIIEPYPIASPPPHYYFDVPRFLHVRAIKIQR